MQQPGALERPPCHVSIAGDALLTAIVGEARYQRR